MEDARDWERRFGEVKAGLNPQKPPSPPKRDAEGRNRDGLRIPARLLRLLREAGRLAQSRDVESQLRRLKEQLGHLPLEALEDAGEINRFKLARTTRRISRVLDPPRARTAIRLAA